MLEFTSLGWFKAPKGGDIGCRVYVFEGLELLRGYGFVSVS